MGPRGDGEGRGKQAVTPKEKLIAWLRGLGIRYTEVPSDEFKREWRWLPDFFDAPFTAGLGIHWPYREIVGVPETGWPGILHEAGHLVATDGRLDTTNELVFLGWEWAVMRHLDLPEPEFLRSNKDYGIEWRHKDELYGCIGHLSANLDALQDCMSSLVRDAQKYGTVLDDGTPVAHPNRRFAPLEN